MGIIAIAVGGGPVGVFLMLRRMSLTGDAMAHAILPGAAADLVAGLSLPAMTLGGFVAGVIVAVLSGLVARFTDLKEDASLAAFSLVPGARRHDRVAPRIERRPPPRALRDGAGARRRRPPAPRVHCDDHARHARGALPPPGPGMRGSHLPALGQPGGHADASDLPRARRAEPRRRVPCARDPSRGRHDDAAGRFGAVLEFRTSR